MSGARAMLAAVLPALLGGGCTVVSVAAVAPQGPAGRPVLVTSGGIARPYQSLGLVQVYRSGFTFGWIPVPTDVELQPAINDYLIPEAERRGADAVINLRFHESQYTPALRWLFTIPPLIVVPWPTSVTLSGELVRFVDGPAPGAPLTGPAAPTTAAPPAGPAAPTTAAPPTGPVAPPTAAPPR